MSNPGNTTPVQKEDEFGPDLLSDPTFIPCRDESCYRRELHREHEVVRLGRKIHMGYGECPNCQTPVVVNKSRRSKVGTKRTRDVVRATCPECGWSHTKALKEA